MMPTQTARDAPTIEMRISLDPPGFARLAQQGRFSDRNVASDMEMWRDHDRSEFT